MAFVPSWSPYTLTAQGKLILSPFDLLALIESELEIIDNRRDIERLFRNAVAHRHVSAIESSDSEEETLSESDGDDSEASDCDSDGNSDVTMLQAASNLDSDEELDGDFMPSAEWCNGFIEHFAPHILRDRAPTAPLALQGLSPVPDLVTRGHMMALGFQLIKWDEYVWPCQK
jgi:hypothetical protein